MPIRLRRCVMYQLGTQLIADFSQMSNQAEQVLASAHSSVEMWRHVALLALKPRVLNRKHISPGNSGDWAAPRAWIRVYSVKTGIYIYIAVRSEWSPMGGPSCLTSHNSYGEFGSVVGHFAKPLVARAASWSNKQEGCVGGDCGSV